MRDARHLVFNYGGDNPFRGPLEKVRLGKLDGAKLCDADLTEIDIAGRRIEGAEFVGCRFFNCVLSRSWFSKCTFKHSTFDRCTFTGSVFVGCDLYRVVFITNNLMENTRFSLVSLNQATLGGTLGLRRRSFDANATEDDADTDETQPGAAAKRAAEISAGAGTGMAEDPAERRKLPKLALIQQDREQYRELLEGVPDARIELEVAMRRRLVEAADVWRSLSSLWTSQGYAADAGWAYLQARRQERKHCGQSWRHQTSLWAGVRMVAKWIGLWMADLLCGFGTKLLLAIFWLPLLVAGFGVVFKLGGAVHASSREGSWPQAFLFSTTQMVNVSPGSVSVRGSTAHILASVEVFLGVAMLGLIGFVLGNKIRNS